MKIFIISFILFCLLQYLSWYINPLFSLCAWVPFFYFLFSTRSKWVQCFHILLFISCYHFIVIYWLTQIGEFKGICATAISIIGQSIFLSLIIFPKISNKWLLYLFITCLWVTYEYINHIWVFTFPWLTVGNVFGMKPELVQWYSITGVLGGSCWIIWANILLYEILKGNRQKRHYSITLSVLILPLVLSSTINYSLNNNYEPIKNKINAYIVNTNFNDSYYLTDENKIKAFNLLKNQIKGKVDYLIFPELFLDEFESWMGEFKNSAKYSQLKRICYDLNGTQIVLGIFLNKSDSTGSNITSSKIKFNKFNCAVQIDTSKTILLKIKKVYVPFDEYMPAFAQGLRMNSARYAQMPGNNNFFQGYRANTFISICYESVNSVFYANSWHDENLIIMMASEAFLKKSFTARDQYLNICRIRAVETGKYIFKASNGGYSAVIKPNGSFDKLYDSSMIHLFPVTGYRKDGITIYMHIGAYLNLIYPFILLILLILYLFKSTVKNKIH